MEAHNIFYVSSSHIKGKEVIVPCARSQHITKALRKKSGETITITDGRGYRYEAELIGMNRSEMRARILSSEYIRRKSSLDISLGFVPVKGSRNDTIVEKGTELGVLRFILFTSERSVLGKIGKQKMSRFQNIAQGAMIQSQQYHMPEIIFTPDIMHTLETGEYEKVILADQHGGIDVPIGADKFLLLIGPEGGFSDAERDAFVSHGASPLKLGHARLRSETAAIVGITKILAAYGEL